ncbi:MULTISPECIES: DUF3466 family protein [Colwellia]|uniref:GlyGly-CTERM sorting domain-containing protein n=1 Tax=Colwellia marinimaniae TaxID=1513592 RepID=A0ABQ0MZ00_9GAMM|nr:MULTISPECIES: DUF3466 family protein [Colwellia]GAW97602.1 hypothetical protein MTCD1_03234 [Colwellia marinimaniae]
MKQFSKNILVLAVTSALSLSVLSFSQAATYKVVEVDKDAKGYTYGGKLNINGEMAVSGGNSYNFPVQFDYLDEQDFNDIVYLALTRHDYYFGLEEIEDVDGFEERAKAGNATANDLVWSKMYLQGKNTSTTNLNFEYQIVADAAALLNLDPGSSPSKKVCIFDTDFDPDSSPCTGELTRSTVNIIQGITNSGFIFGTGSAPYLPIDGPATESDGTFKTHWVREHGQRGFYIDASSGEIISVKPGLMEYGGGISALFDMNDNGTAVGYTSYGLSDARVEYIKNTDGGCADTDVLATIPYEICVQKIQSGMYYIQAFKVAISALDELELLGLLVEPHDDDDRAFSSQALAVNNHGVAVGYAQGWDDTDVVTAAVDERMTGSYAVLYKDGKVLDFNQKHYYFRYGYVYSFSRANDINDNGLVVGYTHDINNSVKKLFYVKTTNVLESEMEIVIPKGFFNSSVSTAFAVNSAGVIVGEAQIETHNESSQNPRRTVGFIYDTASDSAVIIDVNTLLKCESDYYILKASDINDAGYISATAIVKVESYDAKGNAILDDSGDPVMIDVARAVLLEPIPDDGITCEAFEYKVERQGASFGSIGLLSLLAVFGLRRRKFNS